MKNRKFIVIMLIATVLSCLALTSCDSNTAKAQLKKDIEEFKESTELGDSFETYSVYVDDTTTANAEGFFEKVKDFDYKITDVEESKDGETAVITLSITTYDFGTAYITVWDSMLDENSVSTDTVELYNRLFKQLNSVEKKEYNKTVKINCSKDADGNWETDLTENQDFVNAVYGGMVDVVKEISNITE